MKTKIFVYLLSAILLCSMIPAVSAAETLPLIIDQADLLSADEETALEAKAQSLRNEFLMDLVILTINRLDGISPQDFADNYYDQNGYGYGENNSGLLFLISMEEREWYISTCGEAIYAFTDYGIQELAEGSFEYLVEDNYADVFDAYLSKAEEFLLAYSQGEPIDGYADYSGDYYHGDQEEIVYYEEEFEPSIFLSFVVGVIVAGISLLFMRLSMNTKRKKSNATDYMNANSFQLKTKQDLFLYSKVSKVRRQQNTSSNSGGGSSVHRSSSGQRHGGGGGRF